MRTKLRMHFSLLFCVIAAGVLVMTLGLFPTQTVSASSILGTITHPGFLPRALALDETRNRLFVFGKSNSRIYIYNASTLQELGNIQTSLADSLSMVVDESAGSCMQVFLDRVFP